MLAQCETAQVMRIVTMNRNICQISRHFYAPGTVVISTCQARLTRPSQ